MVNCKQDLLGENTVDNTVDQKIALPFYVMLILHLVICQNCLFKFLLQGDPRKMPHFMEMSSCICRLIPLLSDKVGHFFGSPCTFTLYGNFVLQQPPKPEIKMFFLEVSNIFCLCMILDTSHIQKQIICVLFYPLTLNDNC